MMDRRFAFAVMMAMDAFVVVSVDGLALFRFVGPDVILVDVFASCFFGEPVMLLFVEDKPVSAVPEVEIPLAGSQT